MRQNHFLIKNFACLLSFLLIFNQIPVVFAQGVQGVRDGHGNLSPAISLEESLEREAQAEQAVSFIDTPVSLIDPNSDFFQDSPLSPVESSKEKDSSLDSQSDDTYSGTSGTWGQSYEDMWWHDRVRAEEAWAFTRGSGAKVAVIDSGIDIDHEDLADNIFINNAELNGTPGVDDDGNGYIDDINGWNFVSNNNDASDFNGHGTHVAGIIGAVADNMKGIAGIAPEAEIIPVKVLDSNGSGFLSDVIDGVKYAADLGADVINMSLGVLKRLLSTGAQALFESAMEYARSKGSILVAAAGNDGAQAADALPGGFTDVFSIGATNPGTDTLASFSNFGSALDLVAPGVDVLSLKSGESTCTLCSDLPFRIVGSNYLRLSGTSMASPVVAGAVALMRARDPLLTLDDIQRRLRFSSEDLGLPGKDNTYGAGMLDVFTALSMDYYETGEKKTKWLATPDAENVVRFDYDILGKITRKTFNDKSYVDITYWPGTSNKFEEKFYDSLGDWVKTIEYWEDGVTKHFERFPGGIVKEYDRDGNLITNKDINFNDHPLKNISQQSPDASKFEILEGGNTLRLHGNVWKGLDVGDIEVKSDSVLRFEFKSSGAQGEINGIAFTNDLKFASAKNKLLQVYGTQKWGKYQDDAYTNDENWQSFEIPVGDLFTGDFRYLMFLSDADAGQNVDVQYRNISIGTAKVVQPPVVDALPEFTNDSSLALVGTKPANTSIWINDVEVVSASLATTWSYTTTLTGDGLKEFSVVTKDADGIASKAVEVSTTLDQTIPKGTVVIDGGAAETNDLKVDLTLTQTEANPSKMRIFVEGVAVTGWIDYATTYEVTLPSGDGEKEVRVEFQDKAGNVSTDVISDTITLTELADPPYNFNDHPLKNVSQQSPDASKFEILDGGNTLRLHGNVWKGLDLTSIDMNADTVLKFDFKSTGAQGEINGIAFTNDLNFNSAKNKMFQVHGTQKWAKYQNYSYTSSGDWQHFEIPVGDFFTGNFRYLMFLSDADAGQSVDIQYRNVTLSDS